jgi:hypothetical protein
MEFTAEDSVEVHGKHTRVDRVTDQFINPEKEGRTMSKGSSSGGKGGGGGKSGGGGKGSGGKGGWPSGTGNPSGGGRGNAPASK